MSMRSKPLIKLKVVTGRRVKDITEFRFLKNAVLLSLFNTLIRQKLVVCENILFSLMC